MCSELQSVFGVYTSGITKSYFVQDREALGCLDSEGFSLEMTENSTEGQKIIDDCSPVRRHSQCYFFMY